MGDVEVETMVDEAVLVYGKSQDALPLTVRHWVPVGHFMDTQAPFAQTS